VLEFDGTETAHAVAGQNLPAIVLVCVVEEDESDDLFARSGPIGEFCAIDARQRPARAQSVEIEPRRGERLAEGVVFLALLFLELGLSPEDGTLWR
jgi:hypothetical protein